MNRETQILEEYVPLGFKLKTEAQLGEAVKKLKAELADGDITMPVILDGHAPNLTPLDALKAKRFIPNIWEAINDNTVDDRFGLCPECRSNDGYLNNGRCHWFVCKKHKVRWFAGENLFSSWKYETEEERAAAWSRIVDFREVRPVYAESHQSKDAGS